jgi:hypothetical protein
MGSLFAGHLAEVEEDVWVYDVWEATRLRYSLMQGEDGLLWQTRHFRKPLKEEKNNDAKKLVYTGNLFFTGFMLFHCPWGSGV